MAGRRGTPAGRAAGDAMKAPVLIGILTLAALAGAFEGGRIYQSDRDTAAADTATAHATLAWHLALAADSARIDSLTKRRTAETLVRGIEEAEATRLTKEAARHARADRVQDSALAAAKSAGDSLPIVVGQRDEARTSYALELHAADSLVAVVASIRRDSAAAAGILQSTIEGQAKALKAVNAQLRSAAVDLAAAKAKEGFHLALGGWKGTVIKLGLGGLAGYGLARHP